MRTSRIPRAFSTSAAANRRMKRSGSGCWKARFRIEFRQGFRAPSGHFMQPKIITAMKDYNLSLFLADALAGLTVAMVALPLSIAIAIASGADLAKGLITAIVGGVIISLLGGSRVQIGGPTGAFIIVVFEVIADHGYDGLVLATMMAGILMIVAGWLRIGNLIAYVPKAVVNGFTIYIAIIIATSQLNDFFRLGLAKIPADFIEKVSALWAARGDLNLFTLAAGAGGLALIVLLRWLFPRLPGLIVAMGVVSAVVTLAGLPVDSIASRYGELPRGLPMLSLPPVTVARIAELLPSAMVIGFLASVKSLLSAMVADRMIGTKHRPMQRFPRKVGPILVHPYLAECPPPGRLPAPPPIFAPGRNARGGHIACRIHSNHNAGCRPAGGVFGHARAGRTAAGDGMEYERTAQMA